MRKLLLQILLFFWTLGKVYGSNEEYYSTVCRSGRYYLFQQCMNYVRTRVPECMPYFNTQEHFKTICNINWQVPSEAEFNAQYNHFHYLAHSLWPITNQVQTKYYHVEWSGIFESFRPHARQIQNSIARALARWGGILNMRFEETTNVQQASIYFQFRPVRDNVNNQAIAATINAPIRNIAQNCVPYPSTQRAYVFIYPSDWMEFDEDLSHTLSGMYRRVVSAMIKKEHHFVFNGLFDEVKFKSSFYMIILHELGHAFGILHNDQNMYSLMGPVASREYDDLTEFDIAEMKCIYNLL